MQLIRLICAASPDKGAIDHPFRRHPPSDPMGSRLFIHPPRQANMQWNGLLQFKTKNFPLISLNKMIKHELEMP
jgi:hypothetical protein